MDIIEMNMDELRMAYYDNPDALYIADLSKITGGSKKENDEKVEA